MTGSTTRKVLAALAGTGFLLGTAAVAHADLQSGNPDAFFNPRPGGIDVTVQSWTPEDTNCTYNADGIRRDFFLPGHQNDQAKVNSAKATLNFPGVPLFHNWNITITCQNGKSLTTSHWY